MMDKEGSTYIHNLGNVNNEDLSKYTIVNDCVYDVPIAKEGSHRKVIIGVKDNGDFIYGYSIATQYLVQGYSAKTKDAILNEKVAESIGLYYDKKMNVFTDKSKVGKIGDKRNEIRYDFPPKFIVERNLDKFGMHSQTFRITGGLRYTFGVEIETSKGSVPPFEMIKLPLNSVYDGSIRDDENNKVGTEYTTLPLIGDNGFLALKKCLNAIIQSGHEQNNTCSIHVHLGNTDFNKTTVVAFWAVAQKIEKEIFSMLPKSRSRSEHCQMIKKINFDANIKDFGTLIEKYYAEMHKIVGLTNDKTQLSKNLQHPRGAKCHYDKSTPRYWWINFVPAMFNMRGNKVYTIEARNHSASLNYRKIKNWILIIMAMLHYAENYPYDSIHASKITLKEIIEASFNSRISNNLLSYIEERKLLFTGERDAAEYVKTENPIYHGDNIKSIFV